MSFLEMPIPLQQTLVVFFILCLVLSMVDFLLGFFQSKKVVFLAVSSFSFFFSFALVFLSLRGSYTFRVKGEAFEPSLSFLSLPCWLHWILFALSFFLALSLLLFALLRQRRRLSPLSIKESFDSLPNGLCFYQDDGLVRLVNEAMNQINLALQNEALLNGNAFWERVQRGPLPKGVHRIQDGEATVLFFLDRKVLSFRKSDHHLDGKIIHEILSVDLSQEYRLNAELKEDLIRLERVRKRLLEYGENVGAFVKEEEELKAKAKIHDALGGLLALSKKRLKQDLGVAQRKELLSFWKIEIEALKNQKEEAKSGLDSIFEAARLVGVRIDYFGQRPAPGSREEKILAHAMHECLTNTISHAEGTSMMVRFEEKDGACSFWIQNDGKKPNGPIQEGGGLSNLRCLVERENGTMEISSDPRFELRVEAKVAKQ